MACCWPSGPRASPAVAHALAYCHAIERLAGGQPSRAAGLVRVLYAELERVANHLDVAVRLADAAGLAVATARFALHKERVLRLVSRMCGSRFGRGVVVPGGVSALPRLTPAEIRAELARLRKADRRGRRRADGHLIVPGPAARHRAAVAGARAAARGARPDRQGRRVRRRRAPVPPLRRVPRWAGRAARTPPGTRWPGCGCAGRRWTSLSACSSGPPTMWPNDRPLPLATCEPADGHAAGWAEAPQGEVIYDVTCGPAGSPAAIPGRRRSTTSS